MNIKPKTQSTTIPWGPGTSVPDRNVEVEVAARDLISDLTDEAVLHLNHQDHRGVGRFGKDTDPCPDRVVRTGEHSHESDNYIKVVGGPTEFQKLSPKRLMRGKTGQGLFAQATWNDEGFLEGERVRNRGKDSEFLEQVRVNENGTLTYTKTFASESC